MTTLIILESPNKAPTVKSFLGKGYRVTASLGHVRDLPKSKMGIDIENDFTPNYINIRGKGDLINNLRKEAKAADRILLATDPDREGEAIGWHLMQVLNVDPAKVRRVTFNSLTKNAVTEGIKNPREINMNLVDAQQARRVLDRFVGYEISPFLWKKIKNGLSAGRVQSVVTRLIVEREDEINAFVSEEYWTLSAVLKTLKGESFEAKFYGEKGKKTDIKTGDEAKRIMTDLENGVFTVGEIKKSVKLRKPVAPFTTSTLQQEANRRLNFQSQRTMKVAQELYDGINIGKKGMHGLITYMRTDSVRIADEAAADAKKFIEEKFGPQYYPAQPNVYKSKKNIQDAHEAVRPADPELRPEDIRDKLSNDQFRLYKLIWERFIASQMKAAEYDTVAADITAGNALFKANGRVLKFSGFLALYGDADDGEEENGQKLPELSEGETLVKDRFIPEQHFTQPPPRYTDGSLVKVLEEKGIGRPATYAPIFSTITSRGYVKRNGKVFEPTELGKITTRLMIEQFSDIVDYNFTAEMEEFLDKIEEGESRYVDVIKNFYVDFQKQLKEADKNLEKIEYKKPVTETDFICEKCGSRMIVKESRYGTFAACPKYPECKNTKKLEQEGEEAQPDQETEEICPACGKKMVLKKGFYGTYFACRDYPECKTTKAFHKDTGVACPKCGEGKVVTRKSRAKRIFYSCDCYPKCDFSSWDLPVNEKCGVCGSFMIKKKGKEQPCCSNKACEKKNG